VETFTDGRDNNFVNVLPSSYKVLTRLLFLNDLLYAGHPYLSRVSSDYKEIKKRKKLSIYLFEKLHLFPTSAIIKVKQIKAAMRMNPQEQK